MSDTEILEEVSTTPNNTSSQKNTASAENECSDFPSMGVDLIKRINIKIAFFLLMIGLFLFSDIFIEKFLPMNYQDGTNVPNTMGTTVQLIILVLCYIVIDLLSQGGVL
jgi:hypothetical protein